MRSENEPLPRLRRIIGKSSVKHEGQDLIVLEDQLRLSDKSVLLLPPALLVLELLDGRHSAEDVRAKIRELVGQDLELELLYDLVTRLDEACLLITDAYQNALERKSKTYRSSSFRPAVHAGTSYSDDSDKLTADLRGFFNGDRGPGEPEYFANERRPVGLIAPHIDMRAGGPCFAHGYHALATGRPSDVYVILGTGHAGVEGLFSATRLDFDTPIGRLETDRDFIDLLEQELGSNPCDEDFRHSAEHVIEYQAVMLQHIFGGRHNFKIVPILVALSHMIFSDDDRFSWERERFDQFCSAVESVMSRYDKTVCFIASADLDHIGPRYHDSFIPQQEHVEESIRKDLEMLTHLEHVDGDSFIRYVMEENDARRICGFSPISAMLRLMSASEGKLLDLDVAQADQFGSFVSYCSLIFH